MEALGWDSCDIVIVTGDAYVDHPSFGMAVIGRLLEAQGFRVGIIAQPDWQSAEPFKVLGKPNLFLGVTAGNMDSMINRYTADRKIRCDDAYTPGGAAGKRPDRAAGLHPALPRGLQGRAHRAGRHRRLAAPHCPLRLLVRQGAPLDAGGRQVRPAAVRQCRPRHCRDRPPPGRARAGRAASPMCAAPPSCAARATPAPRAGSRLIPPAWTSRAASRPSSTPTRPPRSRRRAGQHCAKEERQPCAADRTPWRSSPQPSTQPAPGQRVNVPPRERSVIRLPSLRAGQERPGALRPRQPRAAPGNQPRQCPRPGAGPWRGRPAMSGSTRRPSR